MDMEFEKLIDRSVDLLMDTTAACKHVGDIASAIRVIKDRCCSVLSMVPFNIDA